MFTLKKNITLKRVIFFQKVVPWKKPKFTSENRCHLESKLYPGKQKKSYLEEKR